MGVRVGTEQVSVGPRLSDGDREAVAEEAVGEGLRVLVAVGVSEWRESEYEGLETVREALTVDGVGVAICDSVAVAEPAVQVQVTVYDSVRVGVRG